MQSNCVRVKSIYWFLAFLTVLIVTTSHAAEAQVSIYGTVAATDYGYSYNRGSLNPRGDHVGFGGGSTYNFPIQSRFTAGVDLRGSITPATTGGGFGAASLRFGFVPHHNPFKPYLQIGGGFVTAKIPVYFTNSPSSQTVTTPALDLAFGLDLRISPSFDLRLIELQGAGGSKGSTNTGLGSISTGIVYHFHRT